MGLEEESYSAKKYPVLRVLAPYWLQSNISFLNAEEIRENNTFPNFCLFKSHPPVSTLHQTGSINRLSCYEITNGNHTKSYAYVLLPAELALQDVPGAPLVDPVHEELRHSAELAAFSNNKSLA